MNTIATVRNNATRVALAMTVVLGLAQFASATVTRNRNGSYTAKYSVTCTGGNASDTDAGWEAVRKIECRDNALYPDG